MNRFIIVDGLPYLAANGKAYKVRWDETGFTVGAEVAMASVPNGIYTEREIKAKCAVLDSIGEVTVEDAQTEPDTDEDAQTEPESPFSEMTVPELKALAEEKGIDLGDAKKKADIIVVLEAACGENQDGEDE